MKKEDDLEWVIRNDPQIESQEKYDFLVELSSRECCASVYDESETLCRFDIPYEFTIINID